MKKCNLLIIGMYILVGVYFYPSQLETEHNTLATTSIFIYIILTIIIIYLP